MSNSIKSPFNYTGSKAELAEQLIKHLPSDRTVCYDLFCGGGGFFINAMDKFEKIYANDIIIPLVKFYSWLQRTDWETVQGVLNHNNISKDNQEEYLQLRGRFNNDKSNFINFFLLVCSCTNNMMRFNKSYDFNQTWGKRNYNKSTEERLRVYHEKIYLNPNFEFTYGHFFDVKIKDNSFVYLDPPYLITEAGYNSYWSDNLEYRLYGFLNELDKKGIKFMLSNVLTHKGKTNSRLAQFTKFKIIELGFTYQQVSKKKDVQDTKEIIVINY